MEEKYLLVPVLAALIALSVNVVAQTDSEGLSCEVVPADECDGEGQYEVLRMYNYTNSHADPPGRDYFDYTLCCEQDIHSNGYISSRVRDECEEGEVPIFSFFETYDTHAENPDLNNYDLDLCVGPYMNCTIEEDYTGDKEYVLSLFNSTNAHLSNNTAEYDYDLHCEVSEPDNDSTVCEHHDGWGYEYWWDYEEPNTRWDLVDDHPDYNDHPGDPQCCGDDWENDERVEWPVYRQFDDTLASFPDVKDDWACGVNEPSCAYKNRSYPECYRKNVTGDDYKEICWEGKWSLGWAEGAIIYLDGSVIDWETAELVPGVNMTLRILYEGEVLNEKEEPIDENDTEGNFYKSVEIPEEHVERGRTYTLQIVTEKNGEKSYLEKDIILQRERLAHIEECEERYPDWYE